MASCSVDYNFYNWKICDSGLFFQLFVSVKAVNKAGLSSVSSSNGVYMSYLSQGRPPLSHVGIMDLVEGGNQDV